MSEDFEKLVDRYLDGTITPEEMVELEGMLKDSPEARRSYWERAGVDAALESWGSRKRGEVKAFIEPVELTTRSFGNWLTVAGWAAALVLAVLLGVESMRTEKLPDQVSRQSSVPASEGGYPVAYLARVLDVESAAGLVSGQTLDSGREISFDTGLMEVVFYSGATVTVQGPARFVPRSDLEIDFHFGGAEAVVPESAVGFKMVLPDGVITDFGTSFDISVIEGGDSRVQVLEGEIEVDTAASDAKRLRAGEAVTLSETAGLASVEFSPLAVGKALQERSVKEDSDGLKRWQSSVRELEKDESLVVHLALLPEENGLPVIGNHVKRTGGPNSATVISSGWTEGRWKGKPALAFRRPSDRVRLEIPGEFPQATLLAWVRIDGLPREYNGLFFSEYGIDGETHWQFFSDGAFRFGVRPKDSPEISHFHRAYSEPVISPQLFGTWHFLATTYDADSREVVHYLDADEVSRTILSESVPLSFGRATLGNFHDPRAGETSVNAVHRDPQWSFRNWTGAIDEFLIFSRTLSPEEIESLHRAGRKG